VVFYVKPAVLNRLCVPRADIFVGDRHRVGVLLAMLFNPGWRAAVIGNTIWNPWIVTINTSESPVQQKWSKDGSLLNAK
jgi:hypothetical protein